MRLIAKLALAALAGGVLLRRGGDVPILTYYAQGDPQWRDTLLGDSSTTTIWGAGCMMTALGMTAGALLGAEHDYSPAIMNDLVKRAGGFSGALLRLPIAADACDLYAPDSRFSSEWAPRDGYDDRLHPGASKESMRNLITRTLSRGAMCLVNVDKVFTATGEHWLALHGANGGSFLCADPATGADTPIDAASLSNPHVEWIKGPYDIVGVAPIYGQA